nr:MAG TPA: hypothetical protein [Caudoviricetes sp.]
MKHINMEEFASGAFTVQVNRAMEKVMKNIQDPNTDAKATRKITVTIAFKPNETRNFVATGVVAKTSLAPELGAVTTMTCGTNLKTGDIEAVEIGSELPGQMTFDENTMYENETVQVDTETGEIIGNNKIVDLRKVGEA